MKTDRELLEPAAKAAGVEKRGALFWDMSIHKVWNPLTDDGDALRLSVKLRLEIVPVQNGVVDVCLPSADPFVCACEGGTDPYAATRRAIVRAAAQIGEQL